MGRIGASVAAGERRGRATSGAYVAAGSGVAEQGSVGRLWISLGRMRSPNSRSSTTFCPAPSAARQSRSMCAPRSSTRCPTRSHHHHLDARLLRRRRGQRLLPLARPPLHVGAPTLLIHPLPRRQPLLLLLLLPSALRQGYNWVTVYLHNRASRGIGGANTRREGEGACSGGGGGAGIGAGDWSGSGGMGCQEGRWRRGASEAGEGQGRRGGVRAA